MQKLIVDEYFRWSESISIDFDDTKTNLSGGVEYYILYLGDAIRYKDIDLLLELLYSIPKDLFRQKRG